MKSRVNMYEVKLHLNTRTHIMARYYIICMLLFFLFLNVGCRSNSAEEGMEREPEKKHRKKLL